MNAKQLSKSISPFATDYFVTDGGLETTLIYQEGFELNHFAAFELLTYARGREALKNYYASYLRIADDHNVSYILETPTWRANPDWGHKLGYSSQDLNNLNEEAVTFLKILQNELPLSPKKIIISGCIGPRGDGYIPGDCMSPQEAMDYHREQIQTFSHAGADLVTALTMNYPDEAIGIVQAAKATNIPVVISFTVETDGRLPNGETLREAILMVDDATNQYVEHFMINCAHPLHFSDSLAGDEPWKSRIRGIRANASTKSHAELDEAEELDPGDKHLLSHGYAQLKNLLPEFRIVGGCCGTDHTHIEEVCQYFFKSEEADAY